MYPDIPSSQLSAPQRRVMSLLGGGRQTLEREGSWLDSSLYMHHGMSIAGRLRHLDAVDTSAP